MFVHSSFTAAARALLKFKAASTSKLDQLIAERDAAADALHDSEHNQLKRRFLESQEALAQHRKRHEIELMRLAGDVRLKCPALEIINTLRNQGFAAAERLRSDWSEPTGRFASPEQIAAAQQHAEQRDAKLDAWTAVIQSLPEITGSTTPFTDLASLVNRHKKTLPELALIVIDVPAHEVELLANV